MYVYTINEIRNMNTFEYIIYSMPNYKYQRNIHMCITCAQVYACCIK